MDKTRQKKGSESSFRAFVMLTSKRIEFERSIYRKRRRPSSNFNCSIWDWICYAGFAKSAQSQGTAIATATSAFVALITRPSEMQGGTQPAASQDDFALLHVDDRGHNLQQGLGASPDANDLVEGLIVLRPAIWVA